MRRRCPAGPHQTARPGSASASPISTPATSGQRWVSRCRRSVSAPTSASRTKRPTGGTVSRWLPRCRAAATSSTARSLLPAQPRGPAVGRAPRGVLPARGGVLRGAGGRGGRRIDRLLRRRHVGRVSRSRRGAGRGVNGDPRARRARGGRRAASLPGGADAREPCDAGGRCLGHAAGGRHAGARPGSRRPPRPVGDRLGVADARPTDAAAAWRGGARTRRGHGRAARAAGDAVDAG